MSRPYSLFAGHWTGAGSLDLRWLLPLGDPCVGKKATGTRYVAMLPGRTRFVAMLHPLRRSRQPVLSHRRTRFLEVLEALLWGFPNSRTGCCFPSCEALATKAECARSTVAEALKALEWAGVLT